MKKNLQIAIIVVIAALILSAGYFIWRYFIKSPAETAPTQVSGGAPIPQLNLPVAISTQSIFDYWLNKKTGEIYYLTEGGEIFTISSSGENQDTGSRATGNLSYVKPSSDGTLLLVAFGYPQSPTFAMYNLINKTWLALPAGTTAAAWDPKSNDRIAFLKQNGERSALFILTFSNQRSREIARLAQKDFDLEWVLSDVLYFKEKPSAQVATSLWAYNLKTGIIKPMIKEENSLMVKWLPGGNIGLKFSNNALSLIDANNKFLASTDFTTLPSKCELDLKNNNLLCAAPNPLLFEKLTFSDDYFKRKSQFADDIYQMPLSNLGKGPLDIKISIFSAIIYNNPIDADHLELNGSQLLFINRYDQKLYSLSL